MKAPTLAALVADIALAYPNRGIDKAQYQRDLADVPIDVLTETVLETIRTSREWPPSVGDLRESAAAKILGIPDERDAIRQLEARARWARGGSVGDPPPVHRIAREALEHVGGWYSLRTADRPEVVRGQLLRYYREARHAELRAAAAGDMKALTPA